MTKFKFFFKEYKARIVKITADIFEFDAIIQRETENLKKVKNEFKHDLDERFIKERKKMKIKLIKS